MCEYSLQAVPNRLAEKGDLLVTHRFTTGSIGLASSKQLDEVLRARLDHRLRRSWWSAVKEWLSPPQDREQLIAVCVPPGACLRISQIPKRVREDFFLPAVAEVTFVELSATAYQYRDAVQFRNEKMLLLQYLEEGVCFEVLSTDSTETELASPEPQAEWGRSRS